MIIKLITCQVKNKYREAFSNAQQQWKSLTEFKGFLGQFGGWDKTTDQAVVVAQWISPDILNDFMNTAHDEILLKSTQKSTYNKCDVHLFEYIQYISSPIQNTALPDNAVIRIAFCNGILDHDRFMADQRNVWNPGMSHTEGMLGGYVARSLIRSDYFIVVSFWHSESCHNNYAKNIFPVLRETVSSNEYIEHLSGLLVMEERLWRVESNNDAKL